MFFFLPVAAGIFRLPDLSEKSGPFRVVALLFIIFIPAAFGYWTFERNTAWKNDGTLWSDAGRKSPDQFRVHHNLGVYYWEKGDYGKAESEYLKALKSARIQIKKEKFKRIR